MRISMDTPETTDSDEEYWADNSWDRVVNETIRLDEEQSVPTTPAQRTASPGSQAGSSRTSERIQESSNLSSQGSVRLYPRLDMSDILARAMHTTPSKISYPRASASNSLSYSSGVKRSVSLDVQEVPSDSESDSDEDDFSSPISLSPEGSPRNLTPTIPVNTTNIPPVQHSRLASPFNILDAAAHPAPSDQTHLMSSAPSTPPLSPTSSQGDKPPTPTNATVTTPPSASQSNVQGRSLNRAVTVPVISTTPSSSASMSRSKSMNDKPNGSSASARSPCSGFSLTPNLDGIVRIAHNEAIQRKMDQLSVSWGAQYEIARGVRNSWWTWEDVANSGVLEAVRSKNNCQSAPLVAPIMLKGTQQVDAEIKGANYPLWRELDREQKAIVENRDRGLGLMDEKWEDEVNWYGGKIQQILELVKLSEDEWTLKLLDMRKGRSHRFARYLGSRRILLLKLPKLYAAEMDSVRHWLEQQFVLCGRKFVPFAVKDKKVYMCEVDEDFERAPRREEGDQHRMSLREIVDWHNPLALNSDQAVSKWTARFDLGLSTSVPVLEFAPENICLIPDEYVHGYPRPGEKAPPDTIHTDGCSYMNGAALMTIGKHMSYSSRPTVVQGRFLGSKGVWMLHPEDRDPMAPPRIWVRHSQLKIHHIARDDWTPAKLHALHRSHLIFDLLASPRLTLPARLNRLSILNLAHNGVPKDILIRLMDEGLRAEVDALRKWDGEGAMQLLWHAVNKACGVAASRLSRVGAGLQRALGLAGREMDDRASELELSDDGSTVFSEDGHFNPDGGKPVTIGETVLEKLQAGFSPLDDLLLCTDMRQVIKNTIESYIKEYHISVASSAEAFIVPDPFGVLKPGEIHFKSSQYLKDPLQFLNPQTLTGDVLIYRNPARLPSDIQKVQAVEHPLLAEYVDVIVLPIQGDQTLASLLAGGDVDGDTGVCVFDQDIVNAFHEPERTPEPAGFRDNYFMSAGTISSVSQIIDDITSLPGKADLELQKHLLQGLCDTPVGLYSTYHEKCIYQLGYDHPVTIRIAHMFNYILDSRKTGLRVKPAVKSKDSAMCSGPTPPCLGGPEERSINGRPIRREAALGPFILDDLMAAGARIQDAILTDYQTQIRRFELTTLDQDLVRPYREASNLASIAQELLQVTNLVDDCIVKWRLSPWSRAESQSWTPRKAAAGERREVNDAIIEDLAKTYATIPDGTPTLALLGCLDRIKASYAYTNNPKFAWRLAHAELCRIKADTQTSRPCTKRFADVMTVPMAAARVLAQHTGAVLPRD